MSEVRSGGGKPSRAVLIALRAAAILIVATGLNDIIAGAVPTYEPLHLFLAAVAVITFVDGLLVGTVAAAIATFLYTLLFGPRPPALATLPRPAIASAVTVVVAAVIGAVYRRMRRRGRHAVDDTPAEPRDERHLLEATIIGPAEEIVTALEEMRAELRRALGELTAARDRERTLELELRATRATAAVDAERIIGGANRAIDALSARVGEVEEHARGREAKLEQAWAEARGALTARTHDLETENQRLRWEVDRERQRADAPNARVAELEATVNQLTSERDIAQTTSSSLAQRVEELEAALESASDQASADLVAARLEISELQQQFAQSQTEFDDRLQNIVSHLAEDHEADLGNALMEKEAAKAEARAMTARMHQLQQRLEEDAARRLSQKPPVRAKRILVAHPDADLREAARTSLERVGYEVTTAGDGLEGLRVAIAINADVVIADAVMPKMNGRELCQLLKSQAKTSHIKVVLLTRAVDNVPETGDLAPDAVLKKPVPFETLRNALNGLLA